MLRASVVFAVLAAACYSPSYKDCAISCASNACPSDLACVAGMCRTNGATGACTGAGSDGGTDAPDDAPPDAEPYPTGMWGSASMVDLGMPGNSDPSLTPDLLEMYFTRGGTIYMTGRPTTAMPWSAPQPIDFTMAGVNDQTPSIQPDDVTLPFSSNRPGGSGGYDLWISTRANKTAPWKPPTLIANVSSNLDDTDPFVSANQLTLVFGSTRDTNLNDLFVATRSTPTGDWTVIGQLSVLDTQNFAEAHASLSPDELTIYFQTNRDGNLDLYMSHRNSSSGMFAPPQPITELRDPNNPTANEGDPWVSPDGHHIFFSSNRSGVNQIWEASR